MQQGNDSIDFFISQCEVDSQLEQWSLYHDFLPFPGATAC
jgi:hypothetical protein